jgi:hypothetical protein
VRVGDRRQRRIFGDLVELDPLGIFELEDLREMPCDRFAFAIRVGREVDFAGRFRRRFELLDDVALAFDRQVAGSEIMVDVDALTTKRAGKNFLIVLAFVGDSTMMSGLATVILGR